MVLFSRNLGTAYLIILMIKEFLAMLNNIASPDLITLHFSHFFSANCQLYSVFNLQPLTD